MMVFSDQFTGPDALFVKLAAEFQDAFLRFIIHPEKWSDAS